MKLYYFATVVLAAILLLGACAGTSTTQVQSLSTDSNSALPLERGKNTHAGIKTVGHSDGSLWQDHGALSAMFINQKARMVGDIVTIKIVESSNASNVASTKTGRDSSLSVGLTSFFNLENKFNTSTDRFNPFSPAASTFASDFDGSGTTARSGALTAYITARIIQVLPNGNFVIEGNREVKVNNENQIITLTGVVRPRDISSQNVIQSTYIADARISYSGSGVLNEKQSPGWLMRILDYIWPF